MNAGRIREVENILDNLYKYWRDIRKETIEQLGEREALKIIDFHANNWIDIVKWISSKYKREEQMNIVSSALGKALNKTGQEIQARFKPLWGHLNKYAHPSARQMDLVAEQDFSALVTDSFNEALARELLTVTDKVFDIVYAVVLKRFPKAMSLVQKYEFIDEWQECLPNTIGIIKQ